MIAIATLGIAASCTSSSDELEVKLDSGVVRGASTNGVRSFLGIPFAAPPVGDLRWRAPQPVTPWSGVLDARQTGSACPQTFLGTYTDEDCLYLNVWAPSGARNLPVMVWIHGGAFISGSGGDKWYDGALLASQGVIVVSINYRLGAFGFFAHPALDGEDPAYPTSGNYGLEDQRAALLWVQHNIKAFGGDPQRVTLFGESAGGFSVCAQYVSSRNQGLFEAAISESGLCTSDLVTIGHATAQSLGLDLAAQLGCPGGGASAIACLRGVSTEALLNATMLPPVANQTPGGPFYQTSVLANQLPNVDGFVIEQDLRTAFAAGGFAPLPLVIGNNADEGTLFEAPIYALQVTNDTDYRAALATRFGSANVAAIEAQYPFNAPINYGALAAVTGDAFFVCPTRRAARGAATAGAPVFRYVYDEPPQNPFAQNLGVFHSAEIPFVFGNDDFPLDRIGSDTEMVTIMQAYWLNFAKQHDPNDAPHLPTWAAYDAASDPYRLLDVGAGGGTGYKTAQCDFWDALPPP
ncbi:MAG: carboxylesterase/lipase family protein [Acidobacteriota bacterium]